MKNKTRDMVRVGVIETTASGLPFRRWQRPANISFRGPWQAVRPRRSCGWGR